MSHDSKHFQGLACKHRSRQGFGVVEGAGPKLFAFCSFQWPCRAYALSAFAIRCFFLALAGVLDLGAALNSHFQFCQWHAKVKTGFSDFDCEREAEACHFRGCYDFLADLHQMSAWLYHPSCYLEKRTNFSGFLHLQHYQRFDQISAKNCVAQQPPLDFQNSLLPHHLLPRRMSNLLRDNPQAQVNMAGVLEEPFVQSYYSLACSLCYHFIRIDAVTRE